jgi:hypothetical protein
VWSYLIVVLNVCAEFLYGLHVKYATSGEREDDNRSGGPLAVQLSSRCEWVFQ